MNHTDGMERIQIMREMMSISKLTWYFCHLNGKIMMPKIIAESFNIRSSLSLEHGRCKNKQQYVISIIVPRTTQHNNLFFLPKVNTKPNISAEQVNAWKNTSQGREVLSPRNLTFVKNVTIAF